MTTPVFVAQKPKKVTCVGYTAKSTILWSVRYNNVEGPYHVSDDAVTWVDYYQLMDTEVQSQTQ